MPKRKPPPVKVKLPARLGTLRAPQADLDPGSLILQGKPIPTQIAQAVTAMSLEQSTAGASVLAITVADYTGALIRSQLLRGKVTVTWDGVPFTLVKIEKGDRSVALTFEESAVSVLRLYNKPRKALRAKVTRAQFVRSLITEPTQARIPYRIPEINVRQPIA
jgi:hypothetical protein